MIATLKWTAIAALLGVLVGSVILVAIGFGGNQSMGTYEDVYSAEHLVAESDSIVLARFIDSTEFIKPNISQVDNVAHSWVQMLYRRMEVLESFKGDATAGEFFYEAATTGVRRDDVAFMGGDPPSEFVPLETGQEYVLFLKGGPVRTGYPEEFGDIMWSSASNLYVARLEGNRLLFLASDRYKKSVDARGLERPRDSAAPFELTKQSLSEVIVKQTSTESPTVETASSSSVS
ncbi:MAG: hypothetical protein FJ319_02595 [SAR202 cluster bacterium]|nr:hypothetical protein [SAR202 cluster bacterium]